MIRKANKEDINSILAIYKIAREYMKKNANEKQWGENHPPKNLLESNIQNGELYVFLQDNIIHGVFAFIFGDDQTYKYIEDGSWKNEKPYATIHSIASDGKVNGVFKECFEFCKKLSNNIRIDTHEDNKIMQHLLKKRL